MLLDKSTFVDVRADTYAFFIHDLGLYYHYAKGLLSEFIEEADTIETDDLLTAEGQINEQLRLIRETHSSRSRIISENVKTLLETQDFDADDLAATFSAGGVSIEGHSQTDTTRTCPLPIDVVMSSRLSSTREAIQPESDLNSVDGQVSNYVSADLVASMLGGTVQKGRVLASGTGAAELEEYIENFSDTNPVVLNVHLFFYLPSFVEGQLTQTRTELRPNFILDNSGLAVSGALKVALDNNRVLGWSSSRDTVKLTSPGIGTSGPVFDYPLSTSIVDNSLLLRPGMCLADNSSVVVSKVLGERVTLTTAISSHGTLEFVYKAHASWKAYLPSLGDIKIEGDTEEDRVNSFLSQVQKRKKTCRSLLSSIPDCVNETRFDIRSAHHSVSADYAYNLLERGRLIEYHNLTEQQANRGNLMATAAAHIRAGTRL